MKKIIMIACVALLATGANAGDSPVVSTATAVTGGIVVGAGATSGGSTGGSNSGGAGNNVPPGSPVQVLINGGPMIVSGGSPATQAAILAAMEASGIPTDNVTFTNQ